MPRRLVLSGALVLLVTTVITARNAQIDLVARLGTTNLDARRSIFSSLTSGVVARTRQSSEGKVSAPDQRVLIARGAVAAAPALTESGDFADDCARYRATQRSVLAPGAPTADQARAEQQNQIDSDIWPATHGGWTSWGETRERLETNITELNGSCVTAPAGLPSTRHEWQRRRG